MLLLSIGLEFSLDRLRRLGSIALVGGTLQILVTLGLAAAASWLLGLEVRAEGEGFVVKQEPRADTLLEPGAVVFLELARSVRTPRPAKPLGR